MQDQGEIQRCLNDLNRGDSGAWERLLPLVYEPLRRQAHAVYRGERDTLQATALLHEALIDLLESDLKAFQFEAPGRFFALASRMIRNRLLDHVRRRGAQKRGGGNARIGTAQIEQEFAVQCRELDLIALHDTLEQLREFDEHLWLVTELKFFRLMSNAEIAESLGRGLSTVESDWRFARAWLAQRLGDDSDA